MSKKDEKGFSLILVVIFMSIAALFVGYLLGSWLIGFLVGDSSQMAEKQSDSVVTEPLTSIANKEQIESSEVTVQKNNQAEQEDNKSADKKIESTVQNNSKQKTARNNSAGNYSVQVGAFNNYNNALALKNELADKFNYQTLVTDDSPHQVQVTGFSTREEAESAEAKLESAGYNGFIVTRE